MGSGMSRITVPRLKAIPDPFDIFRWGFPVKKRGKFFGNVLS
jgi:hypothetical protein